MKKLKILLTSALAVAVFVAASSFVSVPEANTEISTTKMTFADLEAIYGANNIVDQFGETVEMEAGAEINFQSNLNSRPCNGESPCGQEQAFIHSVLQKQANECCCSLTYGVECCQRGTLVAILYLVQPNDPNCEVTF